MSLEANDHARGELLEGELERPQSFGEPAGADRPSSHEQEGFVHARGPLPLQRTDLRPGLEAPLQRDDPQEEQDQEQDREHGSPSRLGAYAP